MVERGPDEFYVGYLPKAPPSLARHLRLCVSVLAALAILVAGFLSASHRKLPRATFEFGVVRELTGILECQPCPSLLIARAGATGASQRFSRYLLVTPGKHGAARVAHAFEGRRCTLLGSLVFRDGVTMVEVIPESVKADDDGPVGPLPASEQSLGIKTLVGEIVDSKCYLGVMNPGHLKTHKECAVRCISGGVPPVLLVRDELQGAMCFLLVDEAGGPVNDRVLDLVAEPVEIRGEVVKMGDLFVLKADPKGYRRL